MNRYLLDTNILVFLLLAELDNISKETKEIIYDFNNQIYTSTISVTEILQLFRINKIRSKNLHKREEIINAIENIFYIKILPFTVEHTKTLSKLTISSGHNDPFDHAIISHAITEKLTLVSSDKMFSKYIDQKLLFSFNKR